MTVQVILIHIAGEQHVSLLVPAFHCVGVQRLQRRVNIGVIIQPHHLRHARHLLELFLQRQRLRNRRILDHNAAVGSFGAVFLLHYIQGNGGRRVLGQIMHHIIVYLYPAAEQCTQNRQHRKQGNDAFFMLEHFLGYFVHPTKLISLFIFVHMLTFVSELIIVESDNKMQSADSR